MFAAEEKKILSKRQEELLSLLKNDGLRRINILEGSVRSGKTYISLIVWGFWIAVLPEGKSLMMVGKTLETLKRNALKPLSEIFGEDNFSFSLTKKEARLFDRVIFLEGACNSASEGKIRGLTLDGAYVDEITLIDEGFFSMLLSRLSTEGAKLFGTTNPDTPNHWLKKKYLDNKSLDLLRMSFSIDDNPYLPKSYVESLKKEYTGMYYRRYILGEWVAAEGRIYEGFERKKAVLSREELSERLKNEPLCLAVMGVDYGGNRSASVFCLVGFDRGFRNVYHLAEHYDSKNKSAEALIEAFSVTVEGWRTAVPELFAAYCDSAEQLLVKSFRAVAEIEVKNAMKRPVNSRINMLNRLISSGRVFISEECPHFISAVENAVWDEKKAADVRLDDGTSDIDSLDAFEYAIERFERELFRL